jgi:hypothetical protein
MIPEKGKRYIRRDGTVTQPLQGDIDDGFSAMMRALGGQALLDEETGKFFDSSKYAKEEKAWRVYPTTEEDHPYDLMEEYNVTH